MKEIPDGSIHLMITSPPYFNAPFDYPDLFKNYRAFQRLMKDFAGELHRVLADGRIAAFVTDDVLVKGEKYPVVADITRIMLNAGFRYRDRIMWRKPEGYIRISRRSGVVLQHPYPMYFYPDNVQESILIFQKGRFDYNYVKHLAAPVKEESRLNLPQYQSGKWYLNVWEITNVLPVKGRVEEGVAAFPEEIPRRLITLFTYVGETVLDPFLGSGTTVKVARELKRSSVGYEIDRELKPIILKKISYRRSVKSGGTIEIVERNDAKNLKTRLQKVVKQQRSIAAKKR
jgi:DNA modification methylase